MQLTDWFRRQLDSEVEKSRRALAVVPEGTESWKPHEKSMEFGPLRAMVAIIPSWIALIIKDDELDVAPATPRHKPEPMRTSAELLAALEKSAASARDALAATTDEHLATNWRLLATGKVVSELSRGDMIRDTFAHLAHHRGQMTVYLRLLDAKVPALYGPSADERRYD